VIALNLNLAPVFSLTPSTVADSYGDETESWANPTRIRLRGASVESPATVGDEAPDLETIRNTRVLLVPSRAHITTRDRIEAEGATWRIEGDPIVRVGALDTFTRAVLKRVEKVGPHA
jgi:hypothetical protein